MRIVDPAQVEANPGNPDYFTGQVILRRMASTDPPTNVKMFRVEFAAGARTHWHTHSGVQVLTVLEGRCRFQHEGGPVEEAGAGEVIHIPPGEKHWHGATPDAPMVHLAINIDAETEWLEPVIAFRPEQEAALRYAREKGTNAPVASIRERMTKTFAQLEALLAALPEEAVRIRPAPGRWSVHEIIDHLVESHRPAVDQLRSLLRGERPAGGPVPVSLLSADPLGRPWPGLFRELSGIHRELLALLDGASDETPLAAKAPVLMVVKVREEDGSLTPVEWTHDFDWKAFAVILRAHTLEHVAQIERTVNSPAK